MRSSPRWRASLAASGFAAAADPRRHRASRTGDEDRRACRASVEARRRLLMLATRRRAARMQQIRLARSTATARRRCIGLVATNAPPLIGNVGAGGPAVPEPARDRGSGARRPRHSTGPVKSASAGDRCALQHRRQLSPTGPSRGAAINWSRPSCTRRPGASTSRCACRARRRGASYARSCRCMLHLGAEDRVGRRRGARTRDAAVLAPGEEDVPLDLDWPIGALWGDHWRVTARPSLRCVRWPAARWSTRSRRAATGRGPSSCAGDARRAAGERPRNPRSNSSCALTAPPRWRRSRWPAT